MKSILSIPFVLFGLILQGSSVSQTKPLINESVVFQEENGMVAIEAEHFHKQSGDEIRQWYIFSKDVWPQVGRDDDDPHCVDASGNAYIELLPDTRVTHADKLVGGENFSGVPNEIGVLYYKVNFKKTGRYYVWVRAYSTGSEDNGIHVGIDGTWPESGQRMQWCQGKKSWKWDSRQRTEKQHCGEFLKIFLDVEKAGEHEVQFAMREDGFEMDKFILTTDKSFRPEGAGPQTVLAEGALPTPFPKVEVDLAKKRSLISAIKQEHVAFVMDATDFTSDQIYFKGGWMAINPNKFKEASSFGTFDIWRKTKASYDLVFLGVGEEDGRSTYSVEINGKAIGTYQPPISEKAFDERSRYCKVWENVELKKGDQIKVTTKVGTDGKEFSRARWSGIAFVPVGDGQKVLKTIDMNDDLPGKRIADELTLQAKPNISGELKTWHKVTLTFDGPETAETAEFNPFMDYRFNLTFKHEASGKEYLVPGYFAADGNAGNSSATSGNKWRVHFAPDEVGEWTYQVDFKKGPWVAVSDREKLPLSGEFMDEYTGSFTVTKTDKVGNDFRGKGMLQYVGERYLKFAETDEYFLKVGSDAPENMLAYEEFDGTFHNDGYKDDLVKTWEAHEKHWRESDPTWKDGKGKDLVGALNYLRGKGMNAVSFITNNIKGDDQNVFPYVDYDTYDRFDISKLDQWEVLFSHADTIGMFLHFKLMEVENQGLLDNGGVGAKQRLYYREMLARFGHHLALNWNICEESGDWVKNNRTPPQFKWQRLAAAGYFADHDIYKHHIVIHNGNPFWDILGPSSPYTGPSVQTNRTDFANVHGAVLRWINESKKAGKQWAVACDEPGDAQHSLLPDAENPEHNNARMNGLWGTFLAGGWGTEWYFGYKHAHSDLTCQDYASRDLFWDQGKIALDFFRNYDIPYWEMESHDEMILTEKDYCFAKPGEVYVFLAKKGTTKVDLSSAEGEMSVRWYNPRTGGELQKGKVKKVTAGKEVDLGKSPDKDEKDWVIVVRK